MFCRVTFEMSFSDRVKRMVLVDREEEMLKFVQNRLSGDRRAAFEAAMQSDPQLASEVKVMQAVRAELSEQDEALGSNPDGWERLSNSIEASRAPVNDNRAPLRQVFQMAASAVLAVGVWHFAITPYLSGDERYETVSQETTGPVLQVVFESSAPFGDVAELLAGFGGRITEGPSAVGAYRVEFADAAQRDAAQQAFAERTDLVTDVFLQ